MPPVSAGVGGVRTVFRELLNEFGKEKVLPDFEYIIDDHAVNKIIPKKYRRKSRW